MIHGIEGHREVQKKKRETNALIISASLTKLFNPSLLELTPPPPFGNCGNVPALFKKGDRCNANNYKPITVLQRAVHTQLYSHLRGDVLLPNNLGLDLSYQR